MTGTFDNCGRRTTTPAPTVPVPAGGAAAHQAVQRADGRGRGAEGGAGSDEGGEGDDRAVVHCGAVWRQEEEDEGFVCADQLVVLSFRK